MKRYTRPQSGFTLIELIVVIVVIGILLSAFFVNQTNVSQKQRDAERQRDIGELRSNLEAYYAQHDTYPSRQNLNDAEWRKTNLKKLVDSALSDPLSDNNFTLNDKPAEHVYGYATSAGDGKPCDGAARPCVAYALSATLESGGRYIKQNLN